MGFCFWCITGPVTLERPAALLEPLNDLLGLWDGFSQSSVNITPWERCPWGSVMCCVASHVPVGLEVPWIVARFAHPGFSWEEQWLDLSEEVPEGSVFGCLSVLLILGPAGRGQQSSPPNAHIFIILISFMRLPFQLIPHMFALKRWLLLWKICVLATGQREKVTIMC